MGEIQNNRLAHFPVSFFSVTMGLSGVTIALQKIEHVFKLNRYASTTALGTTAVVFAVLLAGYAGKNLFFPQQVREEFQHPVRLSFFPTMSISMLLLSIALLPVSEKLSMFIWVPGVVLHLYMTLKILSIWIHRTTFKIHHMNPAWFIPVVGNILIPIAGVHHVNKEICWFFFSTGLVFWVVLFAIVFNRIIFHAPLVQKMMPTLFILIAPPAVGFISYVKLTGGIDASARILYYFALFLTLLLFFQARLFMRLKFYISWWAFSFPLAAMTIASTLMSDTTGILLFKYLSLALFAVLGSIILILLVRTMLAVIKKEVCVEEVEVPEQAPPAASQVRESSAYV